MGNFYILLIKAVFIGIATGVVIAIPIGPSGLESVRWTLTKGFKKGIWVAVGSVIADTIDVVLINFGLLDWIETNKLLEMLFWLLSGTITFIIGYRAIKHGDNYNLEKEEEFLQKKGITSHPIFTGIIINLSYPMTHFSWLTFSTTFIRLWKSTGMIPYIAFVSSMLCGILICLTCINFLASKGKKIAKAKNSDKLGKLLAYGITALGVGFFLFGIVRAYLYIYN